MPNEIKLQLDTLNITNFPENLIEENPEYWQNLEILFLSYNQLTQIPSCFSKLKNLKRLEISNNNLTSLDVHLPTNLQELVLCHNSITCLTTFIEHLSNLIYLDLDDNLISEVPVELGKLTKLKELFLSDNKISNIPTTLGELVNLEKLHLNNNKLSNLPNLDNLNKLKWLKVGSNNLTVFPATI